MSKNTPQAHKHASAEAQGVNLPPHRLHAPCHGHPDARTHTTHRPDTHPIPHTLAEPLSLLPCDLSPSHTARHTHIPNQARHHHIHPRSTRPEHLPIKNQQSHMHHTHHTSLPANLRRPRAKKLPRRRQPPAQHPAPVITHGEGVRGGCARARVWCCDVLARVLPIA